jgi:F-type H+-transporting ATPase subunit epsilon
MAETFQLQVATPEKQLVDEQVREVQLPGKDGYMGILPDHAPLLSALGAGLLTYTGEKKLVISGGFVEVFENHVRVLADHAESPESVDVDAARRELDQAWKALAQADTEEASNSALERMQRAQALLDAKGAQAAH